MKKCIHTVDCQCALSPSRRTWLLLAVASLGLAACGPAHAGSTTWTDGVTTPPASFNLNGGTSPLVLKSDTNATFTSNVTVAVNTSSATIDVDPTTAATGKTLTLAGTLDLSSANSAANVTSSNGYNLAITSAVGAGPYSYGYLNPTTANLFVGSGNNVSLGGTSTGNTIGTFTAPAGGSLLKKGTGTWTVTGNSSGTWSTSIQGGNLALAAGGSLGTGGVEVTANSKFSPQAGTSISGGNLYLHNGATLNMADGKIGTFTAHSVLNSESGSSLTYVLDASDQGVDHFIFDNVSNSNDMRSYVVINPLTTTLKLGTYTIVSMSGTSLMENHFGFAFTGDPANHANIISTTTLNGYTLTLSGANSVPYTTLTISGGPSVPEPASGLLVAAASLVLTRRFRRKAV